jgi:hypothetical protein
MDSDGAVWARVPANDVAALDAVIKGVRSATRRDSPLGVLAFDPAAHAFALVDRWGHADDLPVWAESLDPAEATELAALSEAVEEVVAFHVLDEGLLQGVYGHWRSGALVRGLVWTDERWSQATGTPQDWETCMFSSAHLARAIEDTQDDGGDEAATRAAFARGQIVAGECHPRPGTPGLSLLEAMLSVLRAPRWGFSPWPRRRDVLRNMAEG